jgi:hypothetical protein
MFKTVKRRFGNMKSDDGTSGDCTKVSTAYTFD